MPPIPASQPRPSTAAALPPSGGVAAAPVATAPQRLPPHFPYEELIVPLFAPPAAVSPAPHGAPLQAAAAAPISSSRGTGPTFPSAREGGESELDDSFDGSVSSGSHHVRARPQRAARAPDVFAYPPPPGDDDSSSTDDSGDGNPARDPRAADDVERPGPQQRHHELSWLSVSLGHLRNGLPDPVSHPSLHASRLHVLDIQEHAFRHAVAANLVLGAYERGTTSSSTIPRSQARRDYREAMTADIIASIVRAPLPSGSDAEEASAAVAAAVPSPARPRSSAPELDLQELYRVPCATEPHQIDAYGRREDIPARLTALEAVRPATVAEARLLRHRIRDFKRRQADSYFYPDGGLLPPAFRAPLPPTAAPTASSVPPATQPSVAASARQLPPTGVSHYSVAERTALVILRTSNFVFTPLRVAAAARECVDTVRIMGADNLPRSDFSSVPRFDGGIGSLDRFLHSWDAAFGAAFAYRWPANALVAQVVTRFDGVASSWWAAQDRASIHTLAVLELTLRARFAPVGATGNVRDSLNALRHTGTLAQYVANFQAICNSARPGALTDAEQAFFFCNGLTPAARSRTEEAILNASEEDRDNPTFVIGAALRVDSIHSVSVRSSAAASSSSSAVQGRPAARAGGGSNSSGGGSGGASLTVAAATPSGPAPAASLNAAPPGGGGTQRGRGRPDNRGERRGVGGPPDCPAGACWRCFKTGHMQTACQEQQCSRSKAWTDKMAEERARRTAARANAAATDDQQGE